MSTELRKTGQYLERVLSSRDKEQLKRQLQPKLDNQPPAIPGGARISERALKERWDFLASRTQKCGTLFDAQTREQMAAYERNIENFIGTVKVPVGLAGPLRVNGLFAQGDYYVPLATTEATLVASYSRGAQLITKAGGATAMLLNEGISRAPGFAFRTLEEVGQFVMWAVAQQGEFKRIAESTTRHGKLIDVRITVEGNHVYLNFEYTTGDASGQNMTTFATQAVCEYIRDHSPITPQYFFIEANLSGDKKATAQSFLLVRGKKVSAEVTLTADLVRRWLHTTPEQIAKYYSMSAMGGVLSGALGVQGHYANGMAAFYIACGLDAACVAESAVGVTRLETTADGSLYASVTLPNLVVGTVGGGTGLPSQQACLEIIGLVGEGKATALAEVCAALALAGELSITGALAAGDFARSHHRLARGKKPAQKTQ